MKVALVYDRINKWGGAERVLLALHEMFPQAPLYTSVFDKEGALWASVFPKIIPSFLQSFPFAKKHHEFYGWLMPLAFESFNFDEYDLVISVSSEAAKGIMTKPKTLHLCYCLTPTRYLWQSYDDYFKNEIWRILSGPIVDYLRSWDKIAGQRPDSMVAISNNVAKRIKKYYDREAEVIYPPISEKFSFHRFSSAKSEKQKNSDISDLSNIRCQPTSADSAELSGKYFLVVSRLVSYKHIDLAIEVFNKLGLSLKIVGDGVGKKKLMEMARPNIEFLGQNLTDEELIGYYKNCQALIFPGEDDLGLVPIEAQASGRPVIAFGRGGALETIVEGKTGAFFLPQTSEALIKCLKNLKVSKFKKEDCVKNAQKFSKEIFKEKFKKYAESLTKKY